MVACFQVGCDGGWIVTIKIRSCKQFALVASWMRIIRNRKEAMDALLVGADRLGNIPAVLDGFGIRIAGHVSGRDTTHQRRSAPLPRLNA